MASSFSPNLGLELQQTGENSGTWGIKINADLTELDTFAGGRLNKDVSGNSDITLTAAEALNVYHNLSGVLTGNINYVFLAGAGRYYIINNGTSGAYTVTAIISGGTGVVIPQGYSMLVFANPDATAVVEAINYITSLTVGTLNLPSPLPVASGGTGLASGTQYGLPYFSATNAMMSSAAGTATTVLHGNAAGAPAFSGVDLTADVINTLPTGSGGTGLTTNHVLLSGVQFTINGNGAVISSGFTGYLPPAPFAYTINVGQIITDESGSIVIDIWKCTYAQFDAGSTHPVVGDSITGGNPLTISSATKVQDSTLTGWTKTVSAGDILAFHVNSVTSVKVAYVGLNVTKT